MPKNTHCHQNRGNKRDPCGDDPLLCRAIVACRQMVTAVAPPLADSREDFPADTPERFCIMKRKALFCSIMDLSMPAPTVWAV
ncbi:MAG TPA: hypothetical protein PLS67_01340 [Accumulibacter sp.]|jgi:hypothetical protein|nr:hypothetical protein [Accumulibacter sp.]HQC79146.1 hypothetical protein [Accumulibacter sp.]